MAYSASAFRKIDGVPGQCLYSYTTADLQSVVAASGYFDTAVDDYGLTTGDIVYIVYATGGTIGGDFYVVTDTSGTITVTKRT